LAAAGTKSPGQKVSFYSIRVPKGLQRIAARANPLKKVNFFLPPGNACLPPGILPVNTELIF
jgi:hypothetical protein